MTRDVELLTYARLHVQPGADLARIRARKPDLLAELRQEALTQDPRPDLADDSDLWSWLLRFAFIEDGTARDGLFGALHGLRCCGARLQVDGDGIHLLPGGMDADEYARDRTRWLVPHADALVALLQKVVMMM